MSDDWNEMVARVRLEIERALPFGHSFRIEEAERVARAAIAAMREPTSGMLAVVVERPEALIADRAAQGHTDYVARMDAAVAAERLVLAQRWQMMIDAALAGETK